MKKETVTFVLLQVFPINSIFTCSYSHANTLVALQKSLEAMCCFVLGTVMAAQEGNYGNWRWMFNMAPVTSVQCRHKENQTAQTQSCQIWEFLSRKLKRRRQSSNQAAPEQPGSNATRTMAASVSPTGALIATISIIWTLYSVWRDREILVADDASRAHRNEQSWWMESGMRPKQSLK